MLLNEFGRPQREEPVDPIWHCVQKMIERDVELFRELFPPEIYGPDGRPQPSTQLVTIGSSVGIRVPMQLSRKT